MSHAGVPTATFEQAGWGAPATLQLRLDGSGAVLFSPGIYYVPPPIGSRPVAAYRYESSKTELLPVSSDVWNAGTGDIVDCDRAGLTPASGVSADGETLRINGRVITEAGRVRHVRLSPDDRLAAVISASGMSVPSASLIPTLGGPRLIGWRYHRLIEIRSGKLVSDPAFLTFGTSDPAPCWSPDGRLVFYADPAFTILRLVRVGK